MIKFKNYQPHLGQKAFHFAAENLYRYLALISGIRGGKTYAGARESGKQAWNSRSPKNAVYGIIAPTFPMLERTTWKEFKLAIRPLILSENKSKMILTLRNGREVYGFSAEDPDRIRNVTLCGGWVDEARECKNFKELWNVLLGRVLSTGGKLIVTTSPNSFDDVHEIFVENPKNRKEYGVVNFSTYDNDYLDKTAIDSLAEDYDAKLAEQELYGRFVIFEGAVYYTFNRKDNAGELALKVAQYDRNKAISLCCDFNVDPMAWMICQVGVNEKTGLKEVYVIDELFVRNANTVLCCQEFMSRYPQHKAGLSLYGDATGHARHTDSNVTNWRIIQDELKAYGPVMHVPTSNPAERDRINSVNGMICNSKGVRRTFINPAKCKRLIRDLEQVPYKEGTTKIDKTKDLMLTHPSDSLGYFLDKEFPINRAKIEGLKI